MREYVTPLPTPLAAVLPVEGNLTDDVVRHATKTPDRALFSRRDGGPWSEVSAAAFHEQACATAKGLIAAGVECGDRVALLSRTRYEWTLFDYAIWFAGAISVPIYETASAEQIEWILGDAGVCAVVAESTTHVERVEQAAVGLGGLPQLWAIDEGAVDELRGLGSDVDDGTLEARRTAARPGDVATIVYTSGTTGQPRGCALTHGNFLTEAVLTVSELSQVFDEEDAATLLFLPLTHVFARVIQVGCVHAGVRLGHSADVRTLLDDLAAFHPTFILAVPRVFEKVFNTASQTAVADGHGGLFERAADVAIAWSRSLDSGRRALAVRAQHRLFDRLVYQRLRERLGGRCRYAVSGGAPLGERLGHFYRGIGMTVLEGYGLTETTAAVTVNVPDAQRVGTVGRPLPGTGVRVAEDGELLVRGGQVFRGYWRNPAATAEVLDGEGWLHTGDVGDVDAEGFVRVTGRKKEILVTAGGKNVAPAVLEDRIRAHPLVDQCMVVGDGRPYVAALVTLDPDTFRAWRRQHGRGGTARDHAGDPELRAAVQEAIDEANRSVSQAEAVRAFVILPGTWTEEGGQLTPSLKLRRSVVMTECLDAVAALYDSRATHIRGARG